MIEPCVGVADSWCHGGTPKIDPSLEWYGMRTSCRNICHRDIFISRTVMALRIVIVFSSSQTGVATHTIPFSTCQVQRTLNGEEHHHSLNVLARHTDSTEPSASEWIAMGAGYHGIYGESWDVLLPIIPIIQSWRYTSHKTMSIQNLRLHPSVQINTGFQGMTVLFFTRSSLSLKCRNRDRVLECRWGWFRNNEIWSWLWSPYSGEGALVWSNIIDFYWRRHYAQ